MNWYIMVFNINGLKGKEMLLAFMWNVACIYVTLLSHFICSISFSFFALGWIWWRQYNQMAHPSMHFESLNHFFEEESNDSFTSTSFYCSTTPYHKKTLCWDLLSYLELVLPLERSRNEWIHVIIILWGMVVK